MPDLFADPKMLLRASQANIDEFVALSKAALADTKATRAVETNAQTGEIIAKLTIAASFPDRLNYLAFTIISELRHILDQAAHIAVLALTGVDRRDLYFPIVDSPNDLEGRLKKFFPVEMHDAIRRTEPYVARNGAKGGDEPLCVLGKAAQRKHRAVCKAAGMVSHITVKEMIVRGAERFEMGFPVWDSAKDEIIVSRQLGGSISSYDVDLTAFVAISGVGVDERDAHSVLATFHKAVTDALAEIETDTLKAISAKKV